MVDYSERAATIDMQQAKSAQPAQPPSVVESMLLVLNEELSHLEKTIVSLERRTSGVRNNREQALVPSNDYTSGDSALASAIAECITRVVSMDRHLSNITDQLEI